MIANVEVSSREDAVLPASWAITWLTWPIFFLAGVGGMLFVIDRHMNYDAVYPIFIISGTAVLLMLETLFPLKRKWQMTWASFRRDFKYIAMDIVTIPALTTAFGLLAIKLGSGHAGPITDWPLWLAVPVTLIVFEFLQYWQHRLSHAAQGRLGGFLWRVHAAHHLPDKLYLFMHVAAHPLNGFIVQGLVTILPLYYLDATAETVLLFTIINNIQGLTSHFNVDIRTGFFNYLFSGNELHRFHHSAKVSEARNFGVTLSIFDVMFGTFYYRPGQFPENIGVESPELYPHSNDFWRVMMLPFSRR